MEERLQFYIDGRWVEPTERRTLDVINPATEEPIGRIAMGGAKDVDNAVAAAQKAFGTYSQTSREERLELLRRIVAGYQKRYEDLAATMLASTLGIEFDPDAAWNERKRVYETSSMIIGSKSITAFAEGDHAGLWTCAVAAAVFRFT